jgi:hypothetical protein
MTAAAAHFSHNTNLVRLQHAVLCANCELISEANNGRCAACDSEAVLSLSRILGSPAGSEVPLGFSEFVLVADEQVNSIAVQSAA